MQRRLPVEEYNITIHQMSLYQISRLQLLSYLLFITISEKRINNYMLNQTSKPGQENESLYSHYSQFPPKSYISLIKLHCILTNGTNLTSEIS